MKKFYEKISLSDNSYIIPAKKVVDEVSLKEKDEIKLNSPSINEELFYNFNLLNNKSTKTIKDCVFSDFDNGIASTQISYTHFDLSRIKSTLKLKESELHKFEDVASVFDFGFNNNIEHLNFELIQNLNIVENFENDKLNNQEFSISDNVKVIESSNAKQLINLMQKDYTELKSKEELSYYVDGKRYSPIGELKDGIFKWYLNYDFNNETEVQIEYFNETNKKTNVFSKTQNICLIYSKSSEFSASNYLSIDLLPISLDGTPIKKIKIDLNQNFINPIQIKYNFNPLYVYGENYTLNNNIIKHFSNSSFSTGKIDFPSNYYIRKISYNGKYSLPSLPSDLYNKIYTIDNITYVSKYSNLTGKLLPFNTSEINYRLENINFLNESIECLSYIWKIEGIGEWRNIIFTIDDENGCNYGNLMEIESISYRYDGYNGWKNSSNEGNYIKFANNISGEIELEEMHEWGIGESDGVIEYSLDNGKTWHLDLRGKIGNKLLWRSVGEISYLIIWKNNNKEIFYSKNGTIQLDCEEFGGICFEKDKKLKVNVDDMWIDIINGDELSGKSIGKLNWEYEGNKIIFVKDLSEKINLITSDIENQGIHYGRIGVFVNDGNSNCNFYRMLGVNDREVENITCNPLFSWIGENELYSIDFREVELKDFNKEFVKAELNYGFNNIGKFNYEYIFDSNGNNLNNIGFIDYREYFGRREFNVNKGEIIAVYLYDSNGNEVVLPYDILERNDFNLIKFDCFDDVWNQDFKVVVLYNIHNWSETRFRADLEKYDIESNIDTIVEINTVSEPLKVFLYDSLNNELQFPISVNEKTIKIDLSESDKTMFNGLKKVVVLVKGKNDCNGLICEKFLSLKKSIKTTFNPIASVYDGKIFPNKVIEENCIVETEFPFYVENSVQYVIEEHKDYCKEKILSKIWIDSTRKFNSQKNNFKTFICSSDDLRFWGEWKEFNEEFDLCEIGKYFKLKIETFTIECSEEKIKDFYFSFENLYLAKRKNGDDKVYFSLPDELKNNTLYMMRIKSYDGVRYSSWSKLECYLTSDDELNNGAENLFIESKNEKRVVDEVVFNWFGSQNVLTSDNLTTINENNRETLSLTKGKDYVWKVKDENSKNSKGNFSVNIKPPIPTFED